MKKRLLSLLVVIISTTIVALAQVDQVTLVVSGDAPTKDEATTKALRSAIEQAFGVFVSASTEILNDELVKDQIATISSGNIQKYTELGCIKREDGLTEVTLQATVSIKSLTAFAKTHGATAEFAGGTLVQAFTQNKKLIELNKKNSEQAMENLLRQLASIGGIVMGVQFKPTGEIICAQERADEILKRRKEGIIEREYSWDDWCWAVWNMDPAQYNYYLKNVAPKGTEEEAKKVYNQWVADKEDSIINSIKENEFAYCLIIKDLYDCDVAIDSIDMKANREYGKIYFTLTYTPTEKKKMIDNLITSTLSSLSLSEEQRRNLEELGIKYYCQNLVLDTTVVKGKANMTREEKKSKRNKSFFQSEPTHVQLARENHQKHQDIASKVNKERFLERGKEYYFYHPIGLMEYYGVSYELQDNLGEIYTTVNENLLWCVKNMKDNSLDYKFSKEFNDGIVQVEIQYNIPLEHLEKITEFKAVQRQCGK